MTPNIDPSLIAAINRGDCVAFVGAGFSAAAELPSWAELLGCVLSDLDTPESSRRLDSVRSLLKASKEATSRELEMAAQLLYDAAGVEDFAERLKAALEKKSEKPLQSSMQKRLKHLFGIPFRAIVTTNFDPLLPGIPPCGAAFRSLLRDSRPSPWRSAVLQTALTGTGEDSFWPEDVPLIVQLHGQIETPASLVLTRSQYRRHLYANRAYLTVLKSLLATSRVLFLGYSLTDAYLNELRSELIEAFADRQPANGQGVDVHLIGYDEPLGWAVLNDVTEVTEEYYRRHEGLGVIAYETQDNGTGGKDHGGFDEILQALYDETNPVHRLGMRVKDKRILWLDARPDNNDLGRQLIRAGVEGCSSTECQLYEVATLGEAKHLLDGDEPFDLVISYWGYDPAAGSANGEMLLRHIAQLRANGHKVGPVVIFASGGEREAVNRAEALSLGAAAFETWWEHLMETIERLLPLSPS
jgi:hypothetical protein